MWANWHSSQKCKGLGWVELVLPHESEKRRNVWLETESRGTNETGGSPQRRKYKYTRFRMLDPVWSHAVYQTANSQQHPF
jgi:hypothetical protein